GGSGGAPPPPPIPCVEVIPDAGSDAAGSSAAGDAGSNDAGSSDAGSGDAGAPYEPCACVNGFIQAVDADGDGDGTRACLAAPGLDCDDNDSAVTHNTCGGCSALPNPVGEACLDCGAYTCEGPESVVCATKPDAVIVDPDCRCQDALIVARDTDGDGWGTRYCEANAGIDCDDGNNGYVTNECGGCESLPGAEGEDCNQCGVWTCAGTGMACVPKEGSAGQRCDPNNPTNRQTCVGSGFWDYAQTCSNVCYQGNCEVCTPGTYQCVTDSSGSTMLYKCTTGGGTANWTSWLSCVYDPCNATTGTCTTYLFLPRDETFDVVPLLRPGLPWHDVLNTASDSDYG
ncbi:MAG TPA: hypothetical protein VJU61_23685, partial [Polyangiaceae bacterium]|nr:hypothetical protein [Polyangiaceae bacterium]